MKYITDRPIIDSAGRAIVNAELHDVCHYHRRHDNVFVAEIGLFSRVGDELYLQEIVRKIELSQKNEPGVVQYYSSEEQGLLRMLPEEYMMTFGLSPYSTEANNLNDAQVLKDGKPSISHLNLFFTTDADMVKSEIHPTIPLVDDWILQTTIFHGKNAVDWGFVKA